MTDSRAAEDLEWFCRQVRTRSKEHQEAMRMAVQQAWPSIAAGILRQELDSLVRVIFLLKCSPQHRARLLHQAVSGEVWTLPTNNGKAKKITDRDMVDLAQTIHGWTQRVYRFGCGFIHLSNLHDYQARDPFRSLPTEDRDEIASYVQQYHGGSISSESTFAELTAYYPLILNKISNDLEHRLSDLERGGPSRPAEFR